MRQRARVGTGVLAVVLMAPAADATLADATEPAPEQESEYEGGAEPETQHGPGEGAGDLTPGQGSIGPLHEDNTPPLVAPGDPVNPEHGQSEDGPLETQVDDQPVAMPAPAPPPAVAPTPPPAPRAERPAPAPVHQPVPAPPSAVAPVRRTEKPEADRTVKRTRRRPANQPSRPAPAPVAGSPSPVAGRSAAPTPSPARAPSSTVPASGPSPGRSTHIVRAGESLWGIASARLGPGASAAQIAREVQRLWDLNAQAIGTGDPSLLGIGVRLRLG